MRHEIIDIGTNGSKCQKQDNSARDSINVVVAVHNDPFITFDGNKQPLYSGLHLDESKRWVKLVETGVQKGLCSADAIDTAAN